MATGSTTTTGMMGTRVKNLFLENEVDLKISATVIAAVVLLSITLIRQVSGSTSRSNLPPGPLNLPVVGALLSMDTNVSEWYRKMAKKFGKIFYFRLGSYPVLIVGTAEGAEEVLRTKDVVFANRPVSASMRTAAKYVGFESEDILFSNYNEKYTNFKKLLTVHVFNQSAQQWYENVRRREGAFLVEDIQRQINSGGTIHVTDSIDGLTINLLCSLIFGRRYTDSLSSETDQLKHCPEIMHHIKQLILNPNPGDIFPWLVWAENWLGWTKQFKEYNQLCWRVFGQIVQDRREARRTNKSSTDRDILDVLLTLRDEGKISENQVLASIASILLGGTDNSSGTAEWTMLELAKHPDCLAELQKEIDEVVGKGRPVEESDIPKMPYLHAVINEIFRMHPPVPLLTPHFTSQSTTVQGFYVPANTTVLVHVGLIGRDPLYWDDPEKFYPERFVNSKETINPKDGNVFTLLPFGSGRRKCPAAAMGLLTIQRIIATLAHAFDWSPLPGKTSEDFDMTEQVISTCRPAAQLLLRATPRINPLVYTKLLESMEH